MDKIPVKLQILISTKGMKGMMRIAEHLHPEMPGVEYLVGWQSPGELKDIPLSIMERRDFKVIPTQSLGLSKNRNHLFLHATAPYLLISDDDLDYKEDNIKNVIKCFEENPDLSVLTFRYTSAEAKHLSVGTEFSLSHPPRGYFAASVEIGLNLKTISKIEHDGQIPRFNENFGIGGIFGSGEEDIFIHDLMKRGHKGRYFPIEVAHHCGDTTADRESESRDFINTRGAVHLHLHPLTWPGRMIAHAMRGNIPFMKYCLYWMGGVCKAIKRRVFK